MDKIRETLKHKWAEYLLEIIVIVMGILGAFWLDEWRENKNNRQLELNYLILIKSELVDDILKLERLISSTEKTINGFEILTKNINEDKILPRDSVLNLYSRVFLMSDFRSNAETFEAIKSSGHLSLIKNNTFKQQYFILIGHYKHLYNTYDQRMIPIGLDIILEGKKYFAFDKFEFHDPSYVYTQDGANTLAISGLIRRRYIYQLSNCLVLSRELVALIDTEIETSK